MRRHAATILFILIARVASAATIDKALSCGRAGEAGGLGAGTDLVRATINNAQYPEAVCNDSTPGVFYVGRYTKEEDRNKWVIFLQGGGGCTSGQDCASRWCSAGTNFGMDKMSSSLSKAGVRGNGIMDRREMNRFGGCNHVLIYYCSSDNWAGNKLSILSASSSSGATTSYDIPFRGSKIVDAVVDTLRNPPGVRKRGARLGGAPSQSAPSLVLPDLDQASEVLFAGSSAGGEGVRNNADKVGTVLRTNNVRCGSSSACPLIYRAAVDATFGPAWEDLPFTRSTLCMSDPRLCSYEGVFMERYSSVGIATWGAQYDESCVAWHRTNAPGTEWICADGDHVFANHISSELFARQDLQDKLVSGNFVESGFGSAEDFGRLVEADLREFPTISSRAEENSAAGGRPVAVFAPQCTDHESFTSNGPFYNVRVSQNGLEYSFHDVLWNWWSGTQPQVVIRSFNGRAGSAPECP